MSHNQKPCANPLIQIQLNIFTRASTASMVDHPFVKPYCSLYIMFIGQGTSKSGSTLTESMILESIQVIESGLFNYHLSLFKTYHLSCEWVQLKTSDRKLTTGNLQESCQDFQKFYNDCQKEVLKCYKHFQKTAFSVFIVYNKLYCGMSNVQR